MPISPEHRRLESFSTQHMTSSLLIWAPTKGEHVRQDSGTFTLVHTSCSQGKECKTAFWRWDSAIFSSDNTHTTEEQYLGLQLQTRHQATVQYIYTRLSLVAFSPISALSRFMWSSSYRDGGGVLRSGQQEKPPTQSIPPLTQMPGGLALRETPSVPCHTGTLLSTWQQCGE